MGNRLAKLQRVETAHRQLLAIAVARNTQLDARVRDLQAKQEALSAQIGVAPGELARHFGRLHERLTRERQSADHAIADSRLGMHRQACALETWQRMLMRETRIDQAAREHDDLSRIIEAILATDPAASLP
jgi:hypothetical protein